MNCRYCRFLVWKVSYSDKILQLCLKQKCANQNYPFLEIRWIEGYHTKLSRITFKSHVSCKTRNAFCLYRKILKHILISNNYIKKFKIQRNWVFATNSNFLIPKSVQPNSVNLRYFKLRFFDPTEFIVWNI